MHILFTTDPQSECSLTVDFLTKEVYPRGTWAFEFAQKVEERCNGLTDALCTFYFYLRYYETEEAIRMSGPTLYARFTSFDGRELCKRRVEINPLGTLWVHKSINAFFDKDTLSGEAALSSLCDELSQNS
jgi:hypothetical protein